MREKILQTFFFQAESDVGFKLTHSGCHTLFDSLFHLFHDVGKIVVKVHLRRVESGGNGSQVGFGRLVFATQEPISLFLRILESGGY